jgi:hypothetical protein
VIRPMIGMTMIGMTSIGMTIIARKPLARILAQTMARTMGVGVMGS